VARQHLALSPGEFVFLLIANDFKNKGLDALLCALHKLPEFQWRLLVVGRDERSLYDRLIREYGIIHRVNFLAPSSDVLQFYAAVDAYVGPSLQDSFGMPVLEAMSCGLPVVCSSRAGVSEIVTNGVDGIILRDPQDAEEIAVSLRSLFVDPKLARQLGEQAHLTARKHTWNRNAQVTWEWLKELACKKKDSHAAHSKSRPVSQNTPSGTNTPPKLRHPRRPLPALTGVRFFAAFHVVLGHSLPWLDRHFNLPLPFRIFLSHGYLAVALFFLLSGFILAYTYEDQIVTARNRIHFFEARFARIYPVYLLSLILAYPFERGLDTWARVAVLGMVQTWNPCALSLVGAWNYPAWTLSVEAFFYLCFPFVLPWLSRQSNGTLRSMGVVLLGFSVLAQTPLRGLGGISGGLIPLPIWRFPEFLLGIILGLLFLRVPIARQAPSRSIMTFVAVAGVFVILSLPLGPWVSIVMIPYASLISRLAYAKDLWVKFLSTRLMLLLGGASYSIYLMQFPVRSWTRTIFDRLPQSVRFLGSPLTPLILILFSVLVFRFWEEPARRMLRRRSLV
jgi:peptidoglycan/LPS O-acetylase OafA/YrhL